jgi:hypothetical protein
LVHTVKEAVMDVNLHVEVGDRGNGSSRFV